MAESDTFRSNVSERNGVRSVTVDGMTVTADSVEDAIKADQYARKLDAQGGDLQPHRGLIFGQFIPPGGGG